MHDRSELRILQEFRILQREKNFLMERAGFLPVLPIGVIGSCATDVYEPRQIREEATVSRPLWVPQGGLIALIGRAGRKSVFHVTLILACNSSPSVHIKQATLRS